MVGRHHHLGRETLLAPVHWDEAGWPVINHRQPIGLEMEVTGLPPRASWGPPEERDDFDRERLALHYDFVRNPDASAWSLTARPGFLRLLGKRTSLDDVDSPAFVGRRQQHARVRASTLLEFLPQLPGQEAGLVVRSNEQNHYDLTIAAAGAQRRARLRTRTGGASRIVGEAALPSGRVTLTIEAYPDHYEFWWAPEDEAPRSLGSAPTQPLSSEAAGGFTGVHFGLYACAGPTDSMPPADFDWFEYSPHE
jgi:alpha-N-arabinofuranosidase